jgi:hypothetical protein
MQRIQTLAFALATIAGAIDARACRDAHGKLFVQCRSASPRHAEGASPAMPGQERQVRALPQAALTSDQQHTPWGIPESIAAAAASPAPTASTVGAPQPRPSPAGRREPGDRLLAFLDAL